MSSDSKKWLKIFVLGFASALGLVIIAVAGIYFYWINVGRPQIEDVSNSPEMVEQIKLTQRRIASHSIVRAESDLKNATSDYKRWLAKTDLAIYLVDDNRLEEAQRYALEVLADAPKWKDDWNYGNAIQAGNLGLGRIKLRANDITGAVEHLLYAGKTPGSPQLNSFGPNFILADELFAVGKTEEVKEYLKLCRNFWKNGKDNIERWIKIIEDGGKPNFLTSMF